LGHLVLRVLSGKWPVGVGLVIGATICRHRFNLAQRTGGSL
jgi:hypothetical protein